MGFLYQQLNINFSIILNEQRTRKKRVPTPDGGDSLPAARLFCPRF
jgi:hypothetical protein